jgi:hypothetical protein
MPQDSSSRYDILKATLRLLYRSHPRAFIIGAISSLAEPLFFPAIILLLQQLIQRLSVPQGNTSVQHSGRSGGYCDPGLDAYTAHRVYRPR